MLRAACRARYEAPAASTEDYGLPHQVGLTAYTSPNPIFEDQYDAPNTISVGEYDALPDAFALDAYGDHPCEYASARGNCNTVVTSGAKFCAKHSCPACTKSKPSKSVTCPSCATRSINLAGHEDDEFGGFMDA